MFGADHKKLNLLKVCEGDQCTKEAAWSMSSVDNLHGDVGQTELIFFFEMHRLSLFLCLLIDLSKVVASARTHIHRGGWKAFMGIVPVIDCLFEICSQGTVFA